MTSEDVRTPTSLVPTVKISVEIVISDFIASPYHSLGLRSSI